MEQKQRMGVRFNSIDECTAIEDLAKNLWPIEMDEISGSKRKRELFIEWFAHYKNKTFCPNFKHKTPQELAEDIYKVSWDTSDGLFQGLRKHLINWLINH